MDSLQVKAQGLQGCVTVREEPGILLPVDNGL